MSSNLIDGSQYLVGGVLCEFRPRPDYNGRQLKPGMAEKAGLKLVLRAAWPMDDDDDPYPGEYALISIDDSLMRELGISWVASGDVVVVSKES